MKVNMKKLTILGLPVTMLAAGLFAGAMMFGGSNSPTALKNVAHAQRPEDATIQAHVVCINESTGARTIQKGNIAPILKGDIAASETSICPTGTNATGSGFEIRPLDAKARVTFSAHNGNHWLVFATR